MEYFTGSKVNILRYERVDDKVEFIGFHNSNWIIR